MVAPVQSSEDYLQKLLDAKPIDFKKGTIIYLDFTIDASLAVEQQRWSHKEDLMQISFDNGYLIDLGWHPEFNPKGSFKVAIIKDYAWDLPVWKHTCKDVKTLPQVLQEAINFCDAQEK